MQNQLDSKLGKIVVLKINNGKPEQGKLKKWATGNNKGQYVVNFTNFDAQYVTRIIGDVIEVKYKTWLEYLIEAEEANGE